MKFKATAAAALAFVAVPAVAQAAKLTAHIVRDNVYRVEGGTANAGFVVGRDGVIVIDPQRTPLEGAAQIALIHKITDKPIRTIIVTHGDPDHVGGLPAYAADATVIMHENTRTQIVAAAADSANGGPLFGPMYRDLAAHHLPARTIASSESIQIAGVPIQLIYIAPAHSSGDLMVYLPRQKVVFAGDVVLTRFGPFPIIHLGGSSQGWIETFKAMLALDAAVVVPGHGAIEARPKLEQRLRDGEQRRAQIKASVEAGKSLAAIDAVLAPEIGNPIFPGFNTTTYDELTKGYPEARPPWDSVVKRPVAAAQ